MAFPYLRVRWIHKIKSSKSGRWRTTALERKIHDGAESRIRPDGEDGQKHLLWKREYAMMPSGSSPATLELPLERALLATA